MPCAETMGSCVEIVHHFPTDIIERLIIQTVRTSYFEVQVRILTFYKVEYSCKSSVGVAPNLATRVHPDMQSTGICNVGLGLDLILVVFKENYSF